MHTYYFNIEVQQNKQKQHTSPLFYHIITKQTEVFVPVKHKLLNSSREEIRSEFGLSKILKRYALFCWILSITE